MSIRNLLNSAIASAADIADKADDAMEAVVERTSGAKQSVTDQIDKHRRPYLAKMADHMTDNPDDLLKLANAFAEARVEYLEVDREPNAYKVALAAMEKLR